MRRSKILCTVGPASATSETLERMVAAGMDAVRLNFSHGDHDGHRAMIERVRAVAAARGRPLPILQDLQGPRIRVGEPDGGALELVRDAEVVVRAGATPLAPDELPITYDRLAAELEPGGTILIDDGLIRLTVLEAAPDAPDGPRLRCRVVTGGRVGRHKGVNLPGARLSAPALSDKDRADVALGVALGVDLVALSFVRCAQDVVELRELLRAHGSDAQVVAKIERPEALEQIPAILAVADGVMVARGDLGVELPPQRVPLVQRHLVEDANAAGKLVIIATQMLDSMIRNPRPTRAEVQDVATAVMQGSDALMLSGETAAGQYPVAAVQMMADILSEVEDGLRAFEHPPEPALIPGMGRPASAIGRAAVRVANDVDAGCITVFTASGRTAALVSDYRPRQPIVALTHRADVWRRMGLLWGVVPVLMPRQPQSLDEAAHAAREHSLACGCARPGECVVVALGRPGGPDAHTNLLWALDVPE
jgi:pyruvate kinase